MSSTEVLTELEPPTPEPSTPWTRSRRGMPPLLRYMLIRIGLAVPMVWILVTLVFLLMRVIGDPISAALGGRLSPHQIAVRKAAAGLDRPLIQQYGDYLWGILHGDFGTTLTDHRAISDILRVNGAATLELSIYALIIAFAVGVPLGRIAARYRDRIPDVALRLFAILVYAAPVFFVGLLLQLAFSPFGWPVSGQASTSTELTLQSVQPQTHIMLVDAILWGDPDLIADVLEHAVLPSVALGLLIGGVFLRLVRVNMLQTLRMDYVMAATARGVSQGRVLRKHAFRTALVPVVTVMGLQIGSLMGGALLTETTFEWQGLGYTLAQYLLKRDFIAVQGIITIFAMVIAVVSVLIDFVVALVDPRVRF